MYGTSAALLAFFLASPVVDPATPGAVSTQQPLRDLEARVKESPANTSALKDLTVAYRRSARLTGDSGQDVKAWQAISAALRVDPDDPEAHALKAWVQSARHDFEGSVTAARDAIARNPSSDFAYGVLADALTELGRYPEAVKAVEEMMRIRPGAGAYSRAAHLRALHGDRPGAVRLMEMSLEATSASDPEGYAWMLVMLGREHQAMGSHRSAHRLYSRALAIVPDYHLALFHQAESQAADGDVEGAVATLERLHATAPSVASAAHLGDLLAAAGKRERAGALHAYVERLASGGDPSRVEPRWLARFYADHGRKLDEAIALVTAELATHQDIETWDGLSWALHRAGRHREARSASVKALALGTEDARLLYHRGAIEAALGNHGEARTLLGRALALRNLWPAERGEAGRLLGNLGGVQQTAKVR